MGCPPSGIVHTKVVHPVEKFQYFELDRIGLNKVQVERKFFEKWLPSIYSVRIPSQVYNIVILLDRDVELMPSF